MAEVQEESDNRAPPDADHAGVGHRATASSRRSAARRMGYRGINMTSDPQDSGSPDLGDPAWDPLWEVCADLQLPVHFHIGASQTALGFYGNHFWPSRRTTT